MKAIFIALIASISLWGCTTNKAASNKESKYMGMYSFDTINDETYFIAEFIYTNHDVTLVPDIDVTQLEPLVNNFETTWNEKAENIKYVPMENSTYADETVTLKINASKKDLDQFIAKNTAIDVVITDKTGTKHAISINYNSALAFE